MEKQSGFTLLELMITIAILAVLVGLGLPSFQETIRTNRVASITNDLVGAFQLARSEAIRRGRDVWVCPSSNQASCGGTWAQGWIVWDQQADEVIRVWSAVRAGGDITAAPAGSLVFRPMGNAAAARCFDIEFDGALRNIDVGAGGRVRSDQGAC